MFKPIIAGITALSLTIASPAQAQNFDRDDAGKLVVGLLAIAALNAAIENRNDDDSDARPVHHNRNHQAQSQRSNRWSNLNQQTNRPRAVPHSCLQSIETRFGSQNLFGQRCLERNYNQVDNLPSRCAVRVYTSNGPRRGYDPLCLREQGYRSDRRR